MSVSSVLHISHRGGSAEAPENTLHAFKRAVRLGTDMLELDLHATADGEVVVCHDASVDRTTDGTGRIRDLTLAELHRLDAAHWFSPGTGATRTAGDYPLRGRASQDDDLRIPTLRALLEALPDTAMTMELKTGPPNAPAYHEAVAALLEAYDRPVIIGSFSDSVLEAFRAHAPHRTTSASQTEATMFWAEQTVPAGRNIVALQVPPTFEGIEVVTEPFVVAAHDRGLAVHVWTVDEPQEMRRLLDLGVDGIMTDRPTVLAEVLGRSAPA